MTSKEQACVRGIGAVTAYGWGVEELWRGLIGGETAARKYSGLGRRFPDPCWIARVPEGGDRRYGITRYGRAYFAAADEAVQDALNHGWRPGPRVGIVSATTRADSELMRQRVTNFENLDKRKAYVQQSWTTPAFQVMKRYQFHGPAAVVSAACSSGLHSLIIAQRLLATGDATDVIVVAADVGHDGEEIRLFNAIGPLYFDRHPRDICRPLDEGSEGFVIGEGAAAIVLTPDSKGGYMHMLGAALGNDSHHAVGIEPSHRHILDTVDRALAAGAVKGDEIDVYIAHATGTEECAGADQAVLRHIGKRAVAYGTKPLLGHTIAAATALDALILAKGHAEGFIPVNPPSEYGKRHPQLATQPITICRTALQLGLGFGGNIAVAVWGC